MPVDAKHPQYVARAPEWLQLEHCYQGEATVKEQGQVYLKATSGMEEDGMTVPSGFGYKQYLAYKSRAVFPDYTREAVEGLAGIMHRKPAKITLPSRLDPMLTRGGVRGESLQALLRSINEEQLKKGRIGLLLEVPSNKGPADAMPYIATYIAETIINWDTHRRDGGQEQLELVVLNETSDQRGEDLTWKSQTKYRVLALSDVATSLGNPDQRPASGASVYQYATTTTVDLPGAVAFNNASVAGRVLNEIPFVFVNAQDLVPSPDKPPLLGLTNSCLKIYRGEADYRQTLFLQGQETLIVIGEDEVIDPETGLKKDHRVGAGAVISLPENGDAKYVGPSGANLAEQRVALENDRKEAMEQGVKLLEAGGESHASSGDALRVRVASRTANLVTIARTGAAALEAILKIAARWVGANPDEVKVEPNLDFAGTVLTGQELLQLMQAKNMGAPLSLRTIHRLMEEREATNLSYEEEMAEVEGDPIVGMGGLGVDPDPETDPVTGGLKPKGKSTSATKPSGG